jgi:hypothetical protein
MRTSTALTPSSATAPTMPPVSEVSLPMIAFCTVFDSVSSTIRSNGFSCARMRLPTARSRTTRNR